MIQDFLPLPRFSGITDNHIFSNSGIGLFRPNQDGRIIYFQSFNQRWCLREASGKEIMLGDFGELENTLR
jgi:hypothetical protein